MHPEIDADDPVAAAFNRLTTSTALDPEIRDEVCRLIESEMAKLADAIANSQKQLALYESLLAGLRARPE